MIDIERLNRDWEQEIAFRPDMSDRDVTEYQITALIAIAEQLKEISDTLKAIRKDGAK